jgi:hypothetical protein
MMQSPSHLYPVVAMSLGTIPGCIAVGLIDDTDRRVLAAWSEARVDLDLALDVFDQLAEDTVVGALALLAPNAGAPRDLIVIAGGHVHFYDRLHDGLCFVAICKLSANIVSMIAAYRISRGLMEATA